MNTESLRIVILVAEQGSLAGAARVLSRDPSFVSRAVAAVEAELGLRLFERGTRHLSISEAGAAYLARIGPLLDQLDAARDDAVAESRAPAGLMRVTASVAYACEVLTPLLPAYRAAFPGIKLELIPSDDMLDLRANRIDLALRLTDAPVGDLIRTRLRSTRYRVVASPTWLETLVPPEKPSDLAALDCLRFALPEYRGRWIFRDRVGEVTTVPVGGSLVIGNAMCLRQAARDGLGPALLADWLIADDLNAGRLVALLDDYDVTATSFETAVWALYPSRDHLPRKVRATIDFLRSELPEAV